MGIALGSAAFLVVWLGLLLICAALWVFFMIRGLGRLVNGTAKGPAPGLMAEISLVAGVWTIARGGALLGLVAMALPPLALFSGPNLGDVGPPMGRAALVALPLSALAFALCFRRFTHNQFIVLIPAFVGLTSGIFTAERISRAAMCKTATPLGLTDITRHTVLWSLANAPVEFQFEIHGLARNGDDYFGWSYSEMNWYPLPDTVWPNVESGSPACGA